MTRLSDGCHVARARPEPEPQAVASLRRRCSPAQLAQLSRAACENVIKISGEFAVGLTVACFDFCAVLLFPNAFWACEITKISFLSRNCCSCCCRRCCYCCCCWSRLIVASFLFYDYYIFWKLPRPPCHCHSYHAHKHTHMCWQKT